MIIQSPPLKHPGVTHAFFTRAGGVSTGIYASLNCGAGSDDNANSVMENKRRASEQLGVLPEKLLTLYQVHSPDVITVDHTTDIQNRVKADAMVTRTPGIALGILTADCVPILFSDPINKVIGAAHSGWKGTQGNIAGNVIRTMIEMGADRENICVAIGPAIQQASYEVGPEFPDHFTSQDPSLKNYFIPSPNEGHFQFDLTALVKDQIIAEQVNTVDLLHLDTYCDEARFFSYRRMCHRKENDYGRQLSAIALQD